ncbi:amidohydrolase [Enterocloster clostridioformis]|nr:amidohydrolase [Enterocloster clostridioformis]ANU46496.1 amidohydrolase [Lachnoclostridium sp. YL32]NDO31358.1 amidohydrolase [Enterocloster clostridioformis]OXE65210.1 amidohydrolase [Enterocloster clostridioformis]QQQ98787.1 amidohydrolase [Enterocloster clostridioformis]
MKTVITNGIIITMNRNMDMYPDGYVIVEDSRISEVGPMEALGRRMTEWGHGRQEGISIIDAGHGIVMPGMVNTHCHMGMIPFRGLGDDCKDRLRVFLLPMESRAMDRELASLSSRYAICELLLSGVTTVMDMYYFEDAVAEVMDQMGIRGIAGQTVMEEASCDAGTPREAIALGEGLIKRYRNHPRIKGCIAPHGTTTCSSSTLQEIHQVNHRYGVPFTLHVAEMDYEMSYLKEQYGCTPIEYLDRLGVLDSHTLSAHSIRLTEQDISLMAKSGSSVAHCIGSNTKAAKGVAPVSSMLEQGLAVGLGTDGPASGNTLDLFTQMRFCANFHKNETGNRGVFPAKDIVSMATIWGAGALGLDKITGSLEPGKEADLVVVETDSPNMFPVYDPYSALVYSARADNVRDVFVAGRCLVKDKQLVSRDFRQIREDLRQEMNQTAFGDMGNLV